MEFKVWGFGIREQDLRVLGLMRRVMVQGFTWSASWSKVRHSPPALMMRARAVSVKRSAHTFMRGTSYMRASSVTVPTMAAILPSPLSDMNLAHLDRDSGGLCRWVKGAAGA